MDPSIVQQSAHFVFDFIYAIFEKVNMKSMVTPTIKDKIVAQTGEQTTSNSGSENESSLRLEVDSVTSSQFSKDSRSQTARSDIFQEVEDNLTHSIIRLVLMPFKIICNLMSFSFWLPIQVFF